MRRAILGLLGLLGLLGMGDCGRPLSPAASETPLPVVTPTRSATPARPASSSPHPSPTLPPAAPPTPTLPPRIYPSPRPRATGVVIAGNQLCPSLQGVEAAQPSPEEARALLQAYFNGDLETRRRLSDPAHWPDLIFMPTPVPGSTPTPIPLEEMTAPRPARESPYGELIANMCGSELANRLWWVVRCAGPCANPQRPISLDVDVYLLRRAGRWLIALIFP